MSRYATKSHGDLWREILHRLSISFRILYCQLMYRCPGENGIPRALPHGVHARSVSPPLPLFLCRQQNSSVAASLSTSCIAQVNSEQKIVNQSQRSNVQTFLFPYYCPLLNPSTSASQQVLRCHPLDKQLVPSSCSNFQKPNLP